MHSLSCRLSVATQAAPTCIRKYYIIDSEEKTTAFFTEMDALTPHCVINKAPSEELLAKQQINFYASAGVPFAPADIPRSLPHSTLKLKAAPSPFTQLQATTCHSNQRTFAPSPR